MRRCSPCRSLVYKISQLYHSKHCTPSSLMECCAALQYCNELSDNEIFIIYTENCNCKSTPQTTDGPTQHTRTVKHTNKPHKRKCIEHIGKTDNYLTTQTVNREMQHTHVLPTSHAPPTTTRSLLPCHSPDSQQPYHILRTATATQAISNLPTISHTDFTPISR